MRVATEEIFGPVVALIRFTDEDEAVRIANGTQFGLVAGVFSQDGDRALRVSRQIRAGTVFVNNYFRIAVGTGFGGVGYSGIHARRGGEVDFSVGVCAVGAKTGASASMRCAAAR